MDPLQGLLITPLHIIQQEQERLRTSEQDAGQGREEVLALPSLGHSHRRRELGMRGQYLGKQARNLCTYKRIELCEIGLERFTAQPGGNWGIRQLSERGITARPGRRYAHTGDPQIQFVRQPGFADTGFTTQHHQLSTARLQSVNATRGLAPYLL
ncbi:hypothetical protein KDK_53260 [Dictyobacter kobayashii]|uniref:Uncharacterized protein n=1 Tax=Dictyobacter kobayashii TaxID=2014872 RepID=A0A402AQZ6_9CHLR|nr:hypothetical protein KDK_53260 [Dictyobacter kobayashii]